MKKTILLLIAAAVVCGCEKLSVPESAEQEQEQETAMNVKTKNFTFTVKGDFGSATFTRGYMQADGKDMTDLWVLDYMDGTLVQQLHQSSDDADLVFLRCHLLTERTTFILSPVVGCHRYSTPPTTRWFGRLFVIPFTRIMR